MLVRSYLRETIDGIVYKNIECESEMIDVINMFFDEFIVDVPIYKFVISQFDMIVRSLDWENYVKKIIEEGVSIIAVEEKTNNLVGFYINSIIDLQSASEDKVNSKCDLDESKCDLLKNEKLDLHRISDYLCEEMGDVNDLLLERIPNLQKIFDSYAISTSRKLRGRSIGYNLQKYSIKIARNVGTQCALVFTANLITDKILHKLNFVNIKRKAWNTFQIDGKKIFENYQDEEDCGNTFYLDLTN
ncbi:uncharacterized protein LOC105846911 isoform X2 [Hydra vulgaris]|nr:uncharacterized protein LOC105846911 [Hydra vulgaris]XP_047133019.1 uncharacterized protein LOC105846911 [Hydra vulgaris]